MECNQEILKAMGYGEVNKNTCMHAQYKLLFCIKVLMCFASIAIDENEEEMIEIMPRNFHMVK